MRAVIIGSGSIGGYERAKSRIRGGDYIICADGGYDHAVKMGIKPDLIIGDFDSITSVPEDTAAERYPVKKDFTDSEIALKTAAERGFCDMLLLGFTGDRADHTLTNILMLSRFPNAVIADGNNEIRLIRDRLTIRGEAGDTVSIVPVRGDLCGVTTRGLEYPLFDETLYFGQSRGVSNVMTDKECSIECKSGLGLVIKVDKV